MGNIFEINNKVINLKHAGRLPIFKLNNNILGKIVNILINGINSMGTRKIKINVILFKNDKILLGI